MNSTFPVVLDSLHSSVPALPSTPDAPDTNKAIVTNAVLKISMDDVKKQILISTTTGHMITINDEDGTITIVDKNKNTIEMSSAGIKLDSASDITIKAAASITIDAGTTLTIKSAIAVDVQALNVTVKASAALTAQGQTSAELSSGAQTTVRAPMVMIN